MRVQLITFEGDDLDDHKICVYCKVSKPINLFPKHKSRNDGHDSRCRQCKKDREKLVARIKKFAPPMPSVCDCCGKPPISGNGRRKVGLSCDHDPITDTFRGWLCGDCNVSIGLLGDNVEGLQRAIDYLTNNLSKYEARAKKIEDCGLTFV